jgi:hypothetical protein
MSSKLTQELAISLGNHQTQFNFGVGQAFINWCEKGKIPYTYYCLLILVNWNILKQKLKHQLNHVQVSCQWIFLMLSIGWILLISNLHVIWE